MISGGSLKEDGFRLTSVAQFEPGRGRKIFELGNREAKAWPRIFNILTYARLAVNKSIVSVCKG
jgi:hypothetical protein